MPITFRIVKSQQREGEAEQGPGGRDQRSGKVSIVTSGARYPNPDSTHLEATILQSLDLL